MLTLKQFRNKYKLTQKQLAEKLGVSPTTISMYENGRWTLNQYIIDWIKAEYDEDIRPVKKKPVKKKKATWQKTTPQFTDKYKKTYTGRYLQLAEQLRRDGADDEMIEKLLQAEMERDAFENEKGTTDLEAYKEWHSWPEERRLMYLNNAFCSRCGGAVSFDYGYNVRKDRWGIVLEGTCALCGGKIRRVCD